MTSGKRLTPDWPGGYREVESYVLPISCRKCYCLATVLYALPEEDPFGALLAFCEMCATEYGDWASARVRNFERLLADKGLT